LIRHLKHDGDPTITADRAFETGGELIEREAVAAGPYQRFHVQFGCGVAPQTGAMVIEEMPVSWAFLQSSFCTVHGLHGNPDQKSPGIAPGVRRSSFVEGH
jgi:hypothetical protein